MTITKCDICKKSVKDYWKVTRLELPEHSHHHLCPDCTKRYLKTVMSKLKPKSHLRKSASKK